MIKKELKDILRGLSYIISSILLTNTDFYRQTHHMVKGRAKTMKKIKSFEATEDLSKFLERMSILGRGYVSKFIREAVEEKYKKEAQKFEILITNHLQELVNQSNERNKLKVDWSISGEVVGGA